MGRLLLTSIVLASVLLGIVAARQRRNGLIVLAGLVLAFDVFYIVVLYVLRQRWA